MLVKQVLDQLLSGHVVAANKRTLVSWEGVLRPFCQDRGLPQASQVSITSVDPSGDFEE